MDGDGGERKIRRWGVREGKEKEGERGRDVALVSATRAKEKSIKKVDKEYVNRLADYYSAAAASCRSCKPSKTDGRSANFLAGLHGATLIPPKTEMPASIGAGGSNGRWRDTGKRVAVHRHCTPPIDPRGPPLPSPSPPSNPSRTCPRR